MDEHELRNFMFVSFTVNVPNMRTLPEKCSSPKNKNTGKIRAHANKLELGVAT